MTSFVKCGALLLGLSMVFALTGCCHHGRCSKFERETTVRTTVSERVHSHGHCQPPVVAEPVVVQPTVVQPVVVPPAVVMPVCRPPISVSVREDVWESVCVPVPVFRWVWDCRCCQWVSVSCGYRNESRMVCRTVWRSVQAHWDNSRQCYGYLNRNGCWQQAHGGHR